MDIESKEGNLVARMLPVVRGYRVQRDSDVFGQWVDVSGTLGWAYAVIVLTGMQDQGHTVRIIEEMSDGSIAVVDPREVELGDE